MMGDLTPQEKFHERIRLLGRAMKKGFRVDKLKKALAFYADEKNYDINGAPFTTEGKCLIFDNGDCARAALEEGE